MTFRRFFPFLLALPPLIAGCGSPPTDQAQNAALATAQNKAANAMAQAMATPFPKPKLKPGLAPTYTSTQAGFAVWLPGKAEQTTQTMPTLKGEAITAKVISCQTANAAFLVMSMNTPASRAQNPEAFLGGLGLQFANTLNAKVQGARPIRVQGQPGREWTMSLQNNVLRGRTLLARGRSFQIYAITPRKDLPRVKGQIQKFLDSFQLLPHA